MPEGVFWNLRTGKQKNRNIKWIKCTLYSIIKSTNKKTTAQLLHSPITALFSYSNGHILLYMLPFSVRKCLVLELLATLCSSLKDTKGEK